MSQENSMQAAVEHFHYLDDRTGKLTVLNVATGEIVGTEDDNGHLVKPLESQKWVYSKKMADLVCNEIAMGKDLLDICKISAFPPIEVIRHWKRIYPAFSEALILAKEDRAEVFRKKALDACEEPTSKDEVPGATLKTNTYLKVAGYDNPKTYGSNKKVDAPSIGTVNILIDTGIRRPGDPGYNQDATKLVQEVQNAKSHQKRESEEQSKEEGGHVEEESTFEGQQKEISEEVIGSQVIHERPKEFESIPVETGIRRRNAGTVSPEQKGDGDGAAPVRMEKPKRRRIKRKS